MKHTREGRQSRFLFRAGFSIDPVDIGGWRILCGGAILRAVGC
jgi:hypothetical protein